MVKGGLLPRPSNKYAGRHLYNTSQSTCGNTKGAVQRGDTKGRACKRRLRPPSTEAGPTPRRTVTAQLDAPSVASLTTMELPLLRRPSELLPMGVTATAETTLQDPAVGLVGLGPTGPCASLISQP